MKVKNIMFSGFMAAILMSATGAADAAISVASKDYVDAKSGAVSTALNEYKTANDAKVTKNAEDIATNAQSIATNAGTLTTVSETLATKAATTYVDAELAKKVDLTVYNEKMTALGNTDTSLQSQIDAVKQLTGTEGVADQIAEAVNAEKSAREAADAQIRTDFAAADATTLQSAKDYADGLADNYDAAGSADAALATAKTYAESEADAAEAAAKSYADEKDAALKTDLEGQIATASGNASQVATDLASYKTENDAAVAAAQKAGDDAQADLDAYKSTNDTAVAAAQKAGDDAQADLDAYKSSNDTALAGVRTTAEQGVADAAAAAQAAADAADAAAQALTDAKTYAEGQATAAKEAAEATAASALSSAKTEIETALATKITAPAACETQDCVLSINKATNTISWTPLTEPVADYLNQ